MLCIILITLANNSVALQPVNENAVVVFQVYYIRITPTSDNRFATDSQHKTKRVWRKCLSKM